MQSVLPDAITALAQKVVRENQALGRKIALAESCTGGLVCAAITEIPGSSAVLEYGFVTYANEAKTDLLNVSSDLFETCGAVSPAVAGAMALGALAKSGADVAVAISGVAGPGSGTEEKPVGTVVFALAKKSDKVENVVTERKNFGVDKSRAEIRMAATLYALELLLPSAP